MNVTGSDLLTLLVLSLPVAAIAWAVTHEELFREFHDQCVERSQKQRNFLARKFFYLFTCEYCFSHYVAAAVLVATGFRLVFADWRGWIIAWFALVQPALLLNYFGQGALICTTRRTPSTRSTASPPAGCCCLSSDSRRWRRSSRRRRSSPPCSR